MNERIQELYELAHTQWYNHVVLANKSREESPGVYHFFAELIVKECVKICYETTGNSYLNGVAAGTKIMLHFGVNNEH